VCHGLNTSDDVLIARTVHGMKKTAGKQYYRAVLSCILSSMRLPKKCAGIHGTN
jgi:hypothetical protein